MTTIPMGRRPTNPEPTVPLDPWPTNPSGDSRAPAPVVRFATTPPHSRRPAGPGSRPAADRAGTRWPEPAAVALVLLGLTVVALLDPALTATGAATVAVFILAVWGWTRSNLDDTYIALAATLVLIPLGGLSAESFYGSLGQELVWLLIAAFILAAVITASGLVDRCAAAVVGRARSPRGLVHLITTALILTAFAVPSTSGRAALAVPIFVVLARVFADRPQLVKVLALLFPTVILLSAVASLLGAGAHLMTSAVVAGATGSGFGYAGWALLGIPFAVVTSHLAAEAALWLFADRSERSRRLIVTGTAFGEAAAGPLTTIERRCLLVLVVVIALWCSEDLHGIDPAVVALTAALVSTAPWFGPTRLKTALNTVPWSLLVFLAATLALGHALVATGAANWLAGTVFGPIAGLGAVGSPIFVVVVIVVSAAAHLVIQSRSARSAVLVPILVALAPVVDVNPMAIAFASTAAAGFCHTLTSSAKPVAMFGAIDDVETYSRTDLLRLAAWIAPPFVVITLLFSWVVWPLLGMDLFLT